MAAPSPILRSEAARARWEELTYQRWFDLLLRLSRAPDRSREVRVAADALFGALMRERHGEPS